MSGLLNSYLFDSENPLLANIISLWKFDNNGLDSVGSNDATMTDITYNSGLIDDCAHQNSNTDSIEVPDDATLTFGNGTTDVPFSFSTWVYFDSLLYSQFLSKRDSTNMEYSFFWSNSSNTLAFFICDNNISNRIAATASFSPSLSTWYNLIVTYDGSGSELGLNIYVDGVNVTSAQSEAGTYVAMQSTGLDVYIGRYEISNANTLRGNIDETVIFNKELTTDEIDFIYTEGLAGRSLV